MGLCKCPKRLVTNQFCFEHRVNVCQHCMVTNHPKCIVQSYLQWLQDSDYNPICEICTKSLGDEECIRLTCYHIYHWSCVEETFRSLPRTTAPAGYRCPSCPASLFPASNLVAPVADILREKLAGVNWGRAGLGLPLLSEDMDLKASMDSRSSISDQSNHYGSPNNYPLNNSAAAFAVHGGMSGSHTPLRGTPVGASDDESPRIPNGPPYSVVQVQDDNGYDSATFGSRSDGYQGGQTPRRIFETKEQLRPQTSRFDHDEDKYKRKSALEWIIRWWKNTLPPARNRRSAGYINRRYLMIVILIIIVIVTILMVLSRIGRSSIEDDPQFDPLNNPYIQVRDVDSN